MRISNQTPVNAAETPTPSTPRSDSASPSPAPHLDAASSPTLSAQDYGLAPSFELMSLNNALADVPPIRADVVADTISRLAAGDLQTPSALEQTAQAMLGS